MRKSILIILFVLCLSVISFAQDRATIEKNIKKLEKEIVSLERKLEATSSSIRRKRLQRTIDGHKKVIAEYEEEMAILYPKDEASKEAAAQRVSPEVAAETAEVRMEALSMKVIEKVLHNYVDLKAGFSSGALDLGVTYLTHYMGLRPGIGAGYSIGSNYSVLRTDLILMKEMGPRYFYGELTYAGYSDNVTNILGAGDVKKGTQVGIGLTAGMELGNILAEVGYNTALGLKAHAVYRILL